MRDDAAALARIRDLVRQNRQMSGFDMWNLGVYTSTGIRLGQRTIEKILKEKTHKVTVVPRPAIVDQKHADAAVADAHDLMSDDMTRTVHVDEKIFTVPGYSGTVRVMNEDDEPDQDETNKPCGHKRHLPKVMAMAAVSQPVRSRDGKRWIRDGKVSIQRCTKPFTRQRNVLRHFTRPSLRKCDKGRLVKATEVVEGKEAGTTYERDACMDASMYHRLWTMKGGALEKAKAYFQGCFRWSKIKVKEDGAPGHGYNNQTWPPSPNATHKLLDAAAWRVGFFFKKQGGHCPEHNALDEALWWALHCAVRKRSPEFRKRMSKQELLDHLWTVIEEEFWALDPETIDDAFRAVKAAAQQTVDARGWTKGKRVHKGVRAAKKAELARKGWERIPHHRRVKLYPYDGPERTLTPRAEQAEEGGAEAAQGMAHFEVEPALDGDTFLNDPDDI